MHPEEHCTKTWEREMEVLRTKHPYARPPSMSILDTKPDQPPAFVPVEIIDGTVTELSGRLSGGNGPRGGEIGEPATLDPDIRGGKQRVASESDILCVVAS